LERPFQEVVQSGEPDFPFCLAWANESWTGKWHGLEDKILIKQDYPGEDDMITHFRSLENAFHDSRYLKIDDKPLFFIYRPEDIPDPLRFIHLWNELAVKSGFHGMTFIGIIERLPWDHLKFGFDGKTVHQPGHYYERFARNRIAESIVFLKRKFFPNRPFILDYKTMTQSYDFQTIDEPDFIPTIIPGWDNTPRSGKRGWVFQNSTPDVFRKHLQDALNFAAEKKPSNNIVLIKSWNEWAEGNYLEPDRQWGKSYLEAAASAIKSSENSAST